MGQGAPLEDIAVVDASNPIKDSPNPLNSQAATSKTDALDPFAGSMTPMYDLPWYRSKRYFAPISCFLAVFIMYITRYALSQAILVMSKLYAWDDNASAMVNYAFYVGYLSTQVLGGWVSLKYGSKPVVSLGIAISCLSTVLFPLSAAHLPVVVLLRVFLGFGQGVLYPAMVELMSHWVIPSERAFLFNFAWSGGQAGTLFALGSYNALAEVTGGWEWPFYFYSALGIAWFMLWQFGIYERPDLHPSLDPCEAALLASQQERSKENTSPPAVPWLALLSCRPLYVLMCIYFTYLWTFYLLISYLPMYLTDVLGYAGTRQGVLAMAPYLGLWACLLASGYASDALIRHCGFSVGVVRRLMVLLGMGPAACFLLLLSFVQGSSDNATLILVCLFCVVSFSGFAMAGYSPNPMDLSPRYSGILTGLGSIVGGLSGIASLLFTGLMLHSGGCASSGALPGHPTEACLAAWGWLWRVGAAMYILGIAVWLAFLQVTPLDLPTEKQESQS